MGDSGAGLSYCIVGDMYTYYSLLNVLTEFRVSCIVIMVISGYFVSS